MIEIKANEIKSVKVSKEFQEVGIEYLRDEDIATMSVTDNMMVTKIKRLCSEAPDAYKCYVGSYNPDTGEGGSLLFYIGGNSERSFGVDLYQLSIKKDDKILMCSDGLYNLMSSDTLKKHLINGAYHLVKKASSLVDDNLPDDTTAIVLEILENELK